MLSTVSRGNGNWQEECLEVALATASRYFTLSQQRMFRKIFGETPVSQFRNTVEEFCQNLYKKINA